MSDTTKAAAVNWKRIVSYALGIVVVWPFQYMLFVPAAAILVASVAFVGWALRAIKNIGILAVLLLFLPIIGWIILAFVVSGRKQRERHHQEMMAMLRPPGAVGSTSWFRRSLRPWFINQIKAL